jgi:hypothetical protein
MDPYFNLSGITQEADATAETAAPAPATEAAESNNTPAPIDDDQDFTIEQVQESLQQEWGEDYQQKYSEASKAIQLFFKDDPENLDWFSRRVGNDPRLVKLAYRLSAMISGYGKPAAIATPSAPAKSIDEQIREFDVGGSKYERWANGDRRLDAERQELYRRKFPGQIILE